MADDKLTGDKVGSHEKPSPRVFMLLIALFGVTMMAAAYFWATGATTTGLTLVICGAGLAVGGYRYIRIRK
ncbi:hypothetical protein [Demequina salsinemoris]|uniref:hypothetical protein n=1 Tax=Demequina salsinemoris TaxID=577470 RepID=UPI000781D4C2|nr:hypothetical protein [Demequina salsinemoris]